LGTLTIQPREFYKYRKILFVLGGICFFLLFGYLFVWKSDVIRGKTKVNYPNTQETITKLENAIKKAETRQNWYANSGYYAQWVNLEPHNPIPILHLADTYFHLDRYIEAYRTYQKVLRIPNLSQEFREEAESGLQNVLIYSIYKFLTYQQFEQARLLLNEYNQQYPNLPEHQLTRCMIVLQSLPKDWVDGLSCYKERMQKSPYEVMKLVEELGTTRAQMIANVWLISNPDEREVAYNLQGWTNYLQHDLMNAIDSFHNALQIVPDKSSFYGLALTLMEKNEIGEACSIVDQWVKLDQEAQKVLGDSFTCDKGN
jgi:tetratricopeptide (TPR) repeat protein